MIFGNFKYELPWDFFESYNWSYVISHYPLSGGFKNTLINHIVSKLSLIKLPTLYFPFHFLVRPFIFYVFLKYNKKFYSRQEPPNHLHPSLGAIKVITLHIGKLFITSQPLESNSSPLVLIKQYHYWQSYRRWSSHPWWSANDQLMTWRHGSQHKGTVGGHWLGFGWWDNLLHLTI